MCSGCRQPRDAGKARDDIRAADGLRPVFPV